MFDNVLICNQFFWWAPSEEWKKFNLKLAAADDADNYAKGGMMIMAKIKRMRQFFVTPANPNIQKDFKEKALAKMKKSKSMFIVHQ